MNKDKGIKSIPERVIFYFGKSPKELLVQVIALNVFSLVVFAFVENTFFRLRFGMTVPESIKARMLGVLINTPVALFWYRIEIWCKKVFTNSRYTWLRDKWEEVSLFIVKIIVNFSIYIIVGLNKGYFSFDSKLVSKVGTIVLISYFLADFLKYKIVPFVRSLIFNHKEVVFSVKFDVRRGKPRIVRFRPLISRRFSIRKKHLQD